MGCDTIQLNLVLFTWQYIIFSSSLVFWTVDNIQVILDYITPVNEIEELVFLSRADIGKHLTLVDTVDKLLLMTDIHKRTTVEPAYIEFATQESSFLKFIKTQKKKWAAIKMNFLRNGQYRTCELKIQA